MYLFQLTEFQVIGFALVMLRVLSFFIAMPVFSMSSVPVQVKVLASMVISILIYPIVPFDQLDVSTLESGLIFIVIREVLVGLSLGFLTKMFFFAVSITGQLVSLSMGLANAQMFNPAMGAQSSTIEQFQSAIVTLFFFAIDGHHYFIKGLNDSFKLFPINSRFFNPEPLFSIIKITEEIMMIGIQLAMPVMIAILIMNVAMGIVGRAVPQINVLITSLPLNILLGFFVLIISLPLFLEEVNGTLEMVTLRLFTFMKAI